MLRALKYMHTAGVVHGKPAGLLVNADCSLKVRGLAMAQAR